MSRARQAWRRGLEVAALLAVAGHIAVELVVNGKELAGARGTGALPLATALGLAGAVGAWSQARRALASAALAVTLLALQSHILLALLAQRNIVIVSWLASTVATIAALGCAKLLLPVEGAVGHGPRVAGDILSIAAFVALASLIDALDVGGGGIDAGLPFIWGAAVALAMVTWGGVRALLRPRLSPSTKLPRETACPRPPAATAAINAEAPGEPG